MATRKDKADEILAILQEEKGQAKFGELFLVMFERHGLTKAAFKFCPHQVDRKEGIPKVRKHG
jgi:hypothetical protein